jgi:hypothetical protein
MVLPVVIGRREERRGKVSRCFFCFLLFAICFCLCYLIEMISTDRVYEEMKHIGS